MSECIQCVWGGGGGEGVYDYSLSHSACLDVCMLFLHPNLPGLHV